MASEVLAPALTSGSDDRDDVTAVGTPARRDSNSTGSVPRKGSDDVTANKDAPARPQQPQRQSTMVRWARAVLVADLAPYYDTDAETMGDLVRRLTRAGTFNAGNLPAEADPNSDSFSLESLIKLFIQKEREAGWEKRTLGVSFEHLTVTGRGSGVNFGSDVGSFLTKPVDLVRRIASGQLRQPTKTILHDFTGSVRPGEMLLVLGRPGSGCTSLLKSLGNDRSGFQSVTGEVTYDGLSLDQITKSHSGDVVYLPEDDEHLPLLTVKQTLNYAIAVRAASKTRRLFSRDDTVDLFRDVLCSIFGLRHTYNTKVGNDYVRGVSGGERKRVSIAEMLATRAKVSCHDNSTRGLDASSALTYAQALRTATDIAEVATVVSIYQAGESLYELFDKVCLVDKGEMVYYGPASEAKQYFLDMGYATVPRQTTPDFLVSVTTDQRKFGEGVDERSVPKTAVELADAFRKSELGRRNVEDVERYKREFVSSERRDQFVADARAEKAKHVRAKSSFVVGYFSQVSFCIKRRAQLQLADMSTFGVKTFLQVFNALIIGSGSFFSASGVIFFGILFNAFQALAEITTAYAQRPILMRQKRYAMARPSADSLAQVVVELPTQILSITIFDVILYYVAGLQNALPFTILIAIVMTAYFRMLAAWTTAESTATMLAGISVLVFVIYVGYAISRPAMVVWWRWLSYAHPISYGFEALLTNDFRTRISPCATIVPSGAGYGNVAGTQFSTCAVATGGQGVTFIDGPAYALASYEYTYSHTWRNLGIIIGFLIFFYVMLLIGVERQKDVGSAGGVMLFRKSQAPAEVADAALGKKVASDEEMGDAPAVTADEKRRQDKELDEAAGVLEPNRDVFTWRHVNYDIGKETRRLLNDVSGYVKPGKLTALMGSSGASDGRTLSLTLPGAGKTTLLNVLAQRTDSGVVSGDMLVNNKPLPSSFQRDVHLASQTVREALQFSAILRQPASTPRKDKLNYVEDIIKLLSMESYAGAIVGEVGFGLNVEQRKMLTIGVELAAKPGLLIFLDEPTSGLDSAAANSIMQTLTKLSKHGQAILCTIHQPSGELFNMFDRLILLQKGGKTVYNGPLGDNSRDMIEFFSSRSGHHCPDDANPAEFMLEEIGAGAGSKAGKIDWHQEWLDSEERKTMEREIDELHAEAGDRKSAAEQSGDSSRQYASTMSVQLREVTKRVFVDYWRSPTYIAGKVALNAVAGLFIGSSFWNASDTPAGLQLKLFSIFMALTLSVTLAQQIQPVFLKYRGLYETRERPSRMMGWAVQTLASVIVEIPYNILAVTLFFIPWWFMVYQNLDSGRAAYMYFVFVLFTIFWQSFAQAMAALSPNATIASLIFSTMLSLTLIFCGVVQPVNLMPSFWSSWITYVVPFRWILEMALGDVLGGITLTCSASEFYTLQPQAGQTCGAYLQSYLSTAGGYVDNPNAAADCRYCQYRVGDEFLASVGLSYSNRWRDVGFLFVYIIFNFGLVLFATWAFRIHNWKKAPSTQKTPAAAQAEKGAAAGQGTLTGGQRTDEAATDGAAPAKNARETV